MSLNCTLNNDIVTYTFSPRMDTLHSKEIEAELTDQVARHEGGVVFDLQGVEFISSMFLRLCIIAAKRCGPERFSFVNISPPVKKVIKTAGLDSLSLIKE